MNRRPGQSTLLVIGVVVCCALVAALALYEGARFLPSPGGPLIPEVVLSADQIEPSPGPPSLQIAQCDSELASLFSTESHLVGRAHMAVAQSVVGIRVKVTIERHGIILPGRGTQLSANIRVLAVLRVPAAVFALCLKAVPASTVQMGTMVRLPAHGIASLPTSTTNALEDGARTLLTVLPPRVPHAAAMAYIWVITLNLASPAAGNQAISDPFLTLAPAA